MASNEGDTRVPTVTEGTNTEHKSLVSTVGVRPGHTGIPEHNGSSDVETDRMEDEEGTLETPANLQSVIYTAQKRELEDAEDLLEKKRMKDSQDLTGVSETSPGDLHDSSANQQHQKISSTTIQQSGSTSSQPSSSNADQVIGSPTMQHELGNQNDDLGENAHKDPHGFAAKVAEASAAASKEPSVTCDLPDQVDTKVHSLDTATEGKVAGEEDTVDEGEVPEDEEDEEPEPEDEEPEDEEDAAIKENEQQSAREAEDRRLAALREITALEYEFATLRQKLYDNQLVRLETELKMCLDGSHPELQGYYQKIAYVRDYKLRRAYMRQQYELQCIDRETRGTRTAIHQDFFRRASELRSTMLADTTKKWYDINRERRRMDYVVPDATYHVPVKVADRTLSCITGYAGPAQLRYPGEPLAEDLSCENIAFRYRGNAVDKLEIIVDRMRLNNELSDLNGLQIHYNAFPGAPQLPGLRNSDVLEDFNELQAAAQAAAQNNCAP